MNLRKWWWLLSFLLIEKCVGWLDDRPTLESINGNLYLSNAKDKNITLKISGSGYVNINDIDLLHAVSAAQEATRLIERWKSGILDDVESTLQRLTAVIEGPNGLVRKINSIEFTGGSSMNVSNVVKPSETEGGNKVVSTVQVKALSNRLRRLESKVRTIILKLRMKECASDPCQNGGTCIDYYEGFHCHCPPEWQGSLCTVDVNECERLAGKPFGCQNNATCVNLPGSFKCICPTGWHGFHCSTQKSVCDQSNDAELCGDGICVKSNSPLGYNCICKTGWDHLGEGDPACRKDIDECTSSRYPCSVNPLVKCHNVPGTFYCGTCPAGYTGDGFKCQDIDECLVNNGGCRTTPFVQCINTLGSRKCGSCPNGYQGDGVICSYVGSCKINNGGCHSLATCREGPDSMSFCLCPSGYQGSGRGPQGCQPVADICKSNPCVHGTCVAQGTDSFTCTCNDGYTGTTCNVPSNSCSPNPCQNNGICRQTTSGRQYCECTANFHGPTCSTSKSSCGGFLENPTGYVKFPVETGNMYPHGISCAWVIHTNQSMVLNVTFTRFDLEDVDDANECTHDYLQIHDGRSAGGNIIGRYCGNKLPDNGTIISTHNSLYIWFRSDNSINSFGFSFNWTSIKPTCGGDLTAEYGSISSPGFPGRYPMHKDCYWNINVAPGKRIALNFISVMLEEHPTCQTDYLEVNETSYAGSNQLGLFCNHSKPAPITTSGPHAMIHFHSDGVGTDYGFHLSYLTVPGSPNCGGIFTSESGEIVSPGYHSDNYGADMICEWEIRLPEGSHVSLKWLHFEIESSKNCIFDSVLIYEGPDMNSPLLGKYCGSALPPTLSVKSNRVLIRFESDANLVEKGFVIKYEVECGGIFTGPSGILQSPFYPNFYPASKDCKYLISQPPGKAIVLTFDFLDVEEGHTTDNHTNCYFDKIEIRDGDSSNSSLLTTLCGSLHTIKNEPIYSTHNYMYIEFVTDSSIHNLGFKANYTTIDKGCGGIFKTAPGTLNIPGIMARYKYSNNCTWVIRAPPDHAIQLTWLSFPTQKVTVSYECYLDYIEVIEGYGTNDRKSLGKFCTIINPPQVITSQGNDLTLYYQFSTNSAAGTFNPNYQAIYNFVNATNCGGHYFTETGSIRSPNYPKRYPNNKECIWVIEAKNKYVVMLNFKSFELENTTDCSYDYLEIRSGSQQNSPLLGKFCGSRIQDEIISMTNQIYIKFVSDGTNSKKGFKLNWRSTKAGCGGKLRSSSGSIISPNYPQNYYDRATCDWDIRVSAGNLVQITFVDLDIEDDSECAYDYLEISDIVNGYEQNSQRLCGLVTPSLLLSKTNLLKLVFHSNVRTNTRGFYLRYVTGCHNKLSGFQGVIESPNFPQNYENMSNCTWVISVPVGNKINITFSHFDIEDSDGLCKKDYIMIQEGDNNEPNSQLLKTCGSEENVLPLKISSSQRQVFVSFFSNDDVTAGGFRFEWQVDGCTKHLTKPNGEFASPGFPNGDKGPYSYVDCQWLIEVSKDKSIEITFPRIDNTKTRNCLSDSYGAIEIYNGQDETAPILAHNLCYSNASVTYTSTGNLLYLKYSSEVSSASHGFKAIYRSVGIQCGGKFTSHSGVIYSANYPKNYPDNQYCEWLISVDPYHAINLTFTDFGIKYSHDCSKDYLKIYNGNTKDAPLIATHCQSLTALPYYVSTGNEMLVVMRTDDWGSSRGFRAQFNRTCGARIIVDGQGVIRSSPTLHIRTQVNCSWILTAKDPGDKVSLSFSHIDLFQSEDCGFNHIDIYEGEGNEGALLGQLCTNKIPTPFTSTGNALTVHFTSKYGQLIGDNFDAVYSTVNTACGGKYTSESGTIVSPNYPLSYPDKADCTWILSNSPGNRISLSFDEFDLLNSENCDLDYLEIRDDSAIGKLHGVYCGKNIVSITSSHSLWIRFKSVTNTIGNPKGFKAEYDLLFGAELTGDYGEIASPMYPHTYRGLRTFSWRITVDFNYVIKVQFLDAHFDNYDDNCYSGLKIYDGINDEAPKLIEDCGISVPTETITSTGNKMFIQMKNIYGHNNLGNWFHIKWIKIPRMTTTNIETQEIDVSSDSKFIYLTDENGTYPFTSPGYPDRYPNNLKYSWTFISPVGTRVMLRFVTMNIEESENCITDYVAIYNGEVSSFDGNDNEKFVKKVCLSNATMTTYAASNVMTVQFVTDSYRYKPGFSAIASKVCGGIIEAPNGVIQLNNNSTIKRPYTYICEWFVKVKFGRRINVKVVDNRIENNLPKANDNFCRTNYLMLKNGESSHSPLLGVGKYCNGITPTAQNTSSNYLYVKLSISYSKVHFKLLFRELRHDCGGRFDLSKTDMKQEISSPNYPNIPTPHTECVWRFMSTDDHPLSIHFLDRFDLSFSENCELEYVEVRDGGTDTSPLIGRYCRNVLPSSLDTKGNIMYVRYFTDTPEPRNGFKAIITSDDCGSIEREPQGSIIISPNFPNTYGTASHYCSWWIIAPSYYRGISLHFEDFELSAASNCSLLDDHVTIYEKLPGSFNNTKVGTYCGRTKPGVIKILSNEAIVIFTSTFTGKTVPYVKKFRFNYTFSYEECGENFNAMQGEFHTVGYPRQSSYKYCYWEISVPEGYQVVVDIVDLEVRGDQYSKDSYVTFYHDPDLMANIKKIQDSTQSMTVSSSSSFMSVKYVSAGSNRGMKAKFTAKAPAPCGGMINNLEGTLTNPLSSPFNESTYYCKWIIRQPENPEDNKKLSMTLAIEISGIIHVGKATSTCQNVLSYIMIKGDEPVAKVCGNLNKNRITVASSYPSQIVEARNATRLGTVNFVMNYKWHNCGGILSGPSHIIQSPKNVSYPIHCVWKVANEDSDDTMLIQFTKLNLGSCDNSYVQIKGKTYRSPHIGKFCGNEKPKAIISPSNKFTIEYVATEDQGEFEIRVDSSRTVCGGIVRGKETEIKSPGFPQRYSNNTECIWEIVASNGYHVSLTFVERFNLETSKDCQNDYVEIFEWKEEIQNNTDHWYSLAKICGRVPPSTPFNSTTNRMMVKFVSNDKLEGEGFRAVWEEYCGGVYEVTTNLRYIESPNYPFAYPLNIVCNYTLIAKDYKDIVVDFTNFSLEETGNACKFDNLTAIVYRSGRLPASSIWCGKNSPGRKVSKKKMELIFKTDNSMSRSGFKFKYFINDCGGVITTPRIINPIRDDDFDSQVYMSCIWTVKAPANKSVLVRFEELKIDNESNGSCMHSYVRLYEGNTTDSKFRKAVFCGTLNTYLPVIQSVGDTMTIHFYITSFGTSDRFRAAVLFVNGPEQGCGGNINVTGTTNFRTQLAETYEPFQDCHWLVSAPPDYTIQFTINEIDLKNTTFNDTSLDNKMTCNSDYIEVRDGGPYSELIGQFCSSTVPPPITTTFNLLWIRFVSDGLNQGRGVRASLKAVISPCGVTDLVSNNDTKTLTSPGFPSGYPSDITCRWVIRSESTSKMSRIKLNFTDFELEDSDRCESEYLQVTDLNNRGIIREGFGEDLIIHGSSHTDYDAFTANADPMSHYKYCGSELPHLYYSDFQGIEIIYKTSASQQKKKGFKLEYSKPVCSSLYTAIQGRIIHEDISDCRITIEVPKNMTISLYFNKFFLPGGQDCSKGYMQIRDGNFDSPIILSECNYGSPNPVFSTGNRLSIYSHGSLTPNSIINFYDLTYTSTSFGRGCGGQIYNYGGDFTSPMYPNPYRNSSTCIWDISVPKGMKISLVFIVFDIGSKATCHSDYLTIHEPPSSNGGDVNIVSYCGGDIPADFISEKNRIYVTYVTSINNGGTGWEAQFAAK